MRDQAVGLGHDRLADALDVLDAVETRAELLDRAQARGTLADGVEQAGVRDGGRHLGRERRAQGQLVGRPVVRRAVVQHQQPDRLVAEDERDEVDRPVPEPRVDLREVGGPRRVLEHDRPALGDGAVADDGRVGGDLRDGGDHRRIEVAVGDELVRVAAGVEQPQARDLGAEQRLGRVEDVLEHLVQLEVRAHLGDHATERLHAGIRSGGGPVRVAAACGVTRPRGTPSACRCAVVERERHAAGCGYPMNRNNAGAGWCLRGVRSHRMRAPIVRAIGRSYPHRRDRGTPALGQGA